jgi:hypothetical protein
MKAGFVFKVVSSLMLVDGLELFRRVHSFVSLASSLKPRISRCTHSALSPCPFFCFAGKQLEAEDQSLYIAVAEIRLLSVSVASLHPLHSMIVVSVLISVIPSRRRYDAYTIDVGLIFSGNFNG